MTALSLVVSKLNGVTQRGESFTALCPAHPDRNPSLSGKQGDIRVVLTCHAGCQEDAILDALDLKKADLFDDKPNGNAANTVLDSYDYVDENGALLFTVLRKPGKRFEQVPASGARGKGVMNGVRRVLYRLPDVVDAVKYDEPVWVVEGEKDVHALERIDHVATTSPAGAGKWKKDYSESLRNARVRIIADDDTAGHAHAIDVAKSLDGIAASVDMFLPAAGHKDIADHLGAGLDLDDLRPFVLPIGNDPAPTVSDVDPNAPPVDGLELLDTIDATLRRYVAFPTDAARHAVALWVVHTYLLDSFDSTPRLALLSPEKQSGKTRTLELLELLAWKPIRSVNTTPAALFRLIDKYRPTILLDEADTFFGFKVADRHEELRGLVNAGHRKGAVAARCVGDPKNMNVELFPAYCAIALAGIGDLPDTVTDRAVIVAMRRRGPGEAVDSFRFRDVSATTGPLAKQTETWAAQHADKVAIARPVMPPGLTDRPADVWEPLLAIADEIGGRWPDLARAAAVEMNTTRQQADTSLGVRLLADVRTVFTQVNTDKLFTDTLLDRLCEMDEAPWGDLRGKRLDARGLANRLRKYDVAPKQVRIGDDTKKGYDTADLYDAWCRYLPAVGETSETPDTHDLVVSDVSDVSLFQPEKRQEP
jgi:hypothetical protein